MNWRWLFLILYRENRLRNFAVSAPRADTFFKSQRAFGVRGWIL